MGLPFIFGRKKTEETPDITNEELEKMLKSAPIISSNTIKSEVIKLTTSRELKHLKKRMWKFYHK
jgi:hypothetical protein